MSDMARENEASEHMTRSRSILLAVSVVIVYICWGLAMSIQAPLFPREAEKKGATASEVSEIKANYTSVLHPEK